MRGIEEEFGSGTWIASRSSKGVSGERTKKAKGYIRRRFAERDDEENMCSTNLRMELFTLSLEILAATYWSSYSDRRVKISFTLGSSLTAK